VSPIIPNNRRIFEIIAVLLTAVGKFVFIDLLEWRLPFIICTLAAWSTYAVSRPRAIRAYWGFRTDNFGVVLRLLAPLAVISAASFIAIGLIKNKLNITWHILPIMLFYPVWGTIQQLLCVGLVTGNLQDMSKPLNGLHNMLVTATLFSIMHYPDTMLMAGTFVLALVYSLVYQKQRNIYALGLFHGWLGALFYYSIVGRDPFLELLGRFGSSK
jgi:hypothetical protein